MIGFNNKELSLLHVSDLVEGLCLAALSENAKGETYFISSEKFYTWDEVGQITSKVLNKKAFRIRLPHFIVFTVAAFAQFFAMFSSKPATLNIEKAKDLTQRYWTCDTSKAIRDLGYSQKISIEEGLNNSDDPFRYFRNLVLEKGGQEIGMGPGQDNLRTTADVVHFQNVSPDPIPLLVYLFWYLLL